MPDSFFKTAEINALIDPFLPKEEGLQKTVYQAMNEAVRNGGKRVRPTLIYETGRCFLGVRKKTEEAFRHEAAPFMAAMEMIHTFSLIHDDLPCMDNDTLRRGKPTTWYAYGEDMAVLAGDALVLEAFAVASRAVTEAEDPRRAALALKVLAEKSGMTGMIGGQTVDVEQTGKPLSEEQLDFIYRLKTGALIEGSMMIGAILGGAGEQDIQTVEKIGTDIGIAFQIEDDILDETSTTEELGKPVLSDEKNDKTTFVSLYGIEKAKSEAERLSQDAVGLLSHLPGNTECLKEIIIRLTKRKK
jgi:geranylgeranyl diphosphate synthase type II